MSATRVVLVYDVASDRRRARLARVLQSYGVRVQYSVFEAWLDPRQVEAVLGHARRILDVATDELRVYPVCGACARRLRRVGRPGRPTWSDDEGCRVV